MSGTSYGDVRSSTVLDVLLPMPPSTGVTMQNPPGVAGDDWLIRASPRMARPDAAACPTHRRIAMRPQLVAGPAVPFLSTPYEEFGFGPLFTALDLVEHHGWSVERVRTELRGTRGPFRGRGAPVHPVHLAWTAHALERYVAARAREQSAAEKSGLPPTAAVKHPWTWRTRRTDAPGPRGARQYEHTVWGRMYASADGTVRDLWLPSLGRAKSSRPEAEIGAMAQVMAYGAPTPRRRARDEPPAEATNTTLPPALVRVFDVGCADGSVEPLLGVAPRFGEGPGEARKRFEGDAVPAFVAVATATGTHPGESCVDCKAIAGCTDLKRAPSLWGGRPPSVARKRRSVSAWDLRLYAECPAQYHLVRRLHLNDLSTENEGARRGRAVDSWLDARHGEQPVRGCRDRAAPDPATPGFGIGLDDASAREASAMLAEHRLLCPLNGLGADERVLVQHRVTAYVPELDVVVLAVPDLVYTHRGRWIWRETKTSARPLWEREPLLRTYPQLALGVLLFHARVLGDDPRRSWVELEHLREGHGESRLERVDPGRAEIVDEARGVIAGLAQPLLDDTTYEPRTGRHCHGCQARTWCRPGTAYVTDHPLPHGPNEPTHADNPKPSAPLLSRGGTPSDD
ncbi:PD-(D/E)XK nuclease family protein [Streptantibioticus silvisoli]|uniref:PD-(D/E)XK nuclease family protein n=1 Tax=Streptantibioticus silvisoli TaxID=2705255 RepID=A0ABT6W032_9ACTN|nr:PD-(D/E)XK nuclease family protein [Streptantibioticus silvisoli]MDI5964108.1 PD-(D/E)XK nuclease family protein [Streptantibioticus silvisoli]